MIGDEPDNETRFADRDMIRWHVDVDHSSPEWTPRLMLLYCICGLAMMAVLAILSLFVA